jgi:alanine dehydrogenase
MTIMLGRDAIEGAIGMPEAIDLLEAALSHEAVKATTVSPKYVTDFPGGSMRMLFAVDTQAGYCASKLYHNVKGAGTRYVVSLYRLKDGEVLAVIDGQIITDLRTGAASGVMARKVPIAGKVAVGIVGSGNQARTQLESLAAVYEIESAAVYSPTQANREAYAREMSEKLRLRVSAVDSVEAAVRDRPVVAAASNARGKEPILLGKWLSACRLLCAVGNTRAQFAEADVACFREARMVVADSRHAFDEAGELIQAASAGALPEAKRATLGQIVTGALSVPKEGLIAFKSVGSALQDLALAARYYELLSPRGGLPQASGLGSLR